MQESIVIGTRGSKLAMTQTEQVAATLRAHHPDLLVELRIISTRGDRILDVALSEVGDKGLFVKELEVALMNKEVDLAVHSGKDLPSFTPPELSLVAFPKRVDPRDVVILPRSASSNGDQSAVHSSLDVLPQGACVGTSSLRRASQIRALRPDLKLVNVRGNVDTRLNKLDSGEFDAIILASAGLERLGLGERRSLFLSSDDILPAVAQGALIIEARADDARVHALLSFLDDPDTRTAVLAERAFLRRLEGGCQVPIAAYAQIEPDGAVRLRGLVGSLDGTIIIRGERTGSASDAETIGTDLAEELLGRGADRILEAIQQSPGVSVS